MGDEDESGSGSREPVPAVVTPPQVIQPSIPLPAKLEFKGNLAMNWKRFKRLWKNYEVASRLNSQSKELRTATLLTCIGPDI